MYYFVSYNNPTYQDGSPFIDSFDDLASFQAYVKNAIKNEMNDIRVASIDKTHSIMNETELSKFISVHSTQNYVVEYYELNDLKYVSRNVIVVASSVENARLVVLDKYGNDIVLTSIRLIVE